ncbi:sulfatase [Candidatus Hydrogenedentota bacterium]
MNIILVIFDTLRKDCIGAYGLPPWGPVATPHLDAFAGESVRFTHAYPETLPTIQARRAIYTGNRIYPFWDPPKVLKGETVASAGWSAIPEDQDTLSEMLKEAGYRTGLISDVYHMFKPSKNFWRGFDQWNFIRGQERDPFRSGPLPNQDQIDYWVSRDWQKRYGPELINSIVLNRYDRTHEEEYHVAQVMRESALWLEQNRDAEKFFLTVESFSPHEVWHVPEHYWRMYIDEDGQEQIMSGLDVSKIDPYLLKRAQANYSGLVTMCDRWFGYFMETMRVTGRLDDTMVIVTSDHGHYLGDYDLLTKRKYPSAPEVYDVPLMVRCPGGEHGGTVSDLFVQHHDISAQILESAGADRADSVDGVIFLDEALSNKDGKRNHVTAAWGQGITVVTRKWWVSCFANGAGMLLHDLESEEPFITNLASEHPKVADELFALAKADAGGEFPEWLVETSPEIEEAPVLAKHTW